MLNPILNGKKILLAVTGSIAAYKSLSLTRLLIKSGAEVKVVMTPAATSFVSSLSFSTLSKNDVLTSIVSEDGWNNHVELGLWADIMIVAPVTATTLAKMRMGIADNMVVATYLSAKCPVFFAPAMDLDMWIHPSTIDNIKTLESYGNHLIPVGNGELASGLSGDGRMAEPEDIIEILTSFFSTKKDMKDKKVIVTAGPTYEYLDPVRYLGNPSTGKMGIAIAKNCADRGADVHLIVGPTKESLPINTKISNVKSAHQMYEAVISDYPQCDVLIMAAAVADYTPISVSDTKMKKKDEDLKILLKRTIDIAAACGEIKSENQLNIGFALETNDEISHAQRKLSKKNFDFIVLNSLQDKGAGFGHDTNKITIIHEEGKKLEFPLISKNLAAGHIIDQVVSLF